MRDLVDEYYSTESGAPAMTCTRCGEVLDESKAVWLELSQRTGKYTIEGHIPAGESQGCFPFGSACAESILAGKVRHIRRAAR